MKSALAVIGTAIILLLFIIPFWSIVWVFHFGFVTGPEPTIGRFLSYMFWTLPPTALLCAKILSKLVARTDRSISYLGASVTAFVSLAFVQVVMGLVTIYPLFPLGDSKLLGGLGLGLGSAIFLTQLLSQEAE